MILRLRLLNIRKIKNSRLRAVIFLLYKRNQPYDIITLTIYKNGSKLKIWREKGINESIYIWCDGKQTKRIPRSVQESRRRIKETRTHSDKSCGIAKRIESYEIYADMPCYGRCIRHRVHDERMGRFKRSKVGA